MPSPRPARSFGATDFITSSVLATVLLLTTGCGAIQQADAEPAPVEQTQTSSGAPDPTPSEDGLVELDSDTVPDPGQADLAAQEQPAYATKALDALATLPIKGRAPKTGYDRGLFGQAWADVDRNGCDTRNDILDRDLTAKTFKAGSRNCVVLTGSLNDPYTATTISFERGSTTSSAVQIDHVVALSDAWQKGAQQLSVAQRTAFANDPLNLLAVDGPANQQKSDADAATWLPPNKAYRCEFVARQISVKATYQLWVTQAEHDVMAKILGDCTDIVVPTNQAPASAPAPVAPEAPAPPVMEAPAPVPFVEAPAPFYQNCAAVRAAGAAPIHVGQPGFQAKFDGDGDGVGCE